MIKSKDLYIVHYDSEPFAITTDKKEAEKRLQVAKARNRYLPYVISHGLAEFYRNVESYINDYYVGEFNG